MDKPNSVQKASELELEQFLQELDSEGGPARIGKDALQEALSDEQQAINKQNTATKNEINVPK